jgi:CrcB protein
MLRNVLLVGLGGACGAAARFLAETWITRWLGARAGGLPPGHWAILAVNVVGCLAIGVLLGISASRGALPREARLFLVTGLLGGFTTYSTFGAQSLALLEDGAPGRFVLYLGLHLVLGLGAVWAGLALGRLG